MISLRAFPPLTASATALLACLCGAPAAAQAPASAIAIPTISDSTLARIRSEVTVPAGFELSVLAAPPHLTYPTCIHPAGDGVVYVCTDPNLLFGRERRLGRVLRFVDGDGDGTAESYTVFADSLDAVRGITFDGESVYLMHAPTLAAYRDVDGDGVADERRVLVDGLGFGLDDRNGDHTSNGLRLGIDGWIYAAVGDYGFVAARGADGTQIGMHRGGVVRVRPDGSELEIVARGTRNIYDIALDPQLRIFARDNTNNGQAWNSRFHYLPTGADAGYPSLFRNFPEEALSPLADLGAGAATTTVWADHPALPASVRGLLLSADWALNRVYTHGLTPLGATFEITQSELMEVPRPVDIELDPSGNLFIASLSGGSYDYAGEHVGYVLRLRPEGAAAAAVPFGDDEAVLATLLTGSAAGRVAAQQEILRRGNTAGIVTRLETAIDDESVPTAGRTAALFTLKQLLGSLAHPVLERALEDSALRAMALRALADRRGEAAAVPVALIEGALNDPDPGVRLEAVTALARTGGPGAPAALMRAATSPDPTIAHVARTAMVGLGLPAADAALAALDDGPAKREAALYVLARMHSPSVVRALQDRASGAEGEARRQILDALARLYHREGPWTGEWWGNQPSTEGPYFDPVRWEESPGIRAVLVDAVERAGGEELGLLVERLEREGVLPREGGALLQLAGSFPGGQRRRLIDALIGGREVRSDALAVVAAAADAGPAAREAVARLLAALTAPPPATVEALAAAATDATLPVDLRARALTALTRISDADPAAIVRAHAAVIPELPAHPALLQSWRRFVNDQARPEQVERFAALASADPGAERVLAFAVLIQTAARPRNPEPVRARAAELIRVASGDPALAEARRLLGVEGQE